MSYEDLPKLKLPIGQEVYVSDSTLRDGAQMPGLVIKAKEKLRIYDYLNKIGIDKMEVFLFTRGDKETAQAMINSSNDKPEVTGWARANTKDIDLVLDVDEIRETGILMSISDVHIRIKMGLKSLGEAEKNIFKFLNTLWIMVSG